MSKDGRMFINMYEYDPEIEGESTELTLANNHAAACWVWNMTDDEYRHFRRAINTVKKLHFEAGFDRGTQEVFRGEA